MRKKRGKKEERKRKERGRKETEGEMEGDEGEE